MLSPAEQLGLAGAALDARVRQAVNAIPDAALVHVARRLADDARMNEVVYTRDGVIEAVRVMLRPLLVMPEQLSYLHHVCTRILSALARLPELYTNDADVRRVLPLAADEHAWFEDVWSRIGEASNPLYGRLDAVCDFTSARWQDSLRFMEPNLSGVGGIHLGPLAETLVMRDVVPTLVGYDPSLAIELPRDQRDLFLQVLLDQARAVGRSGNNICLIEPKYVEEGPNEQSHLVEYYRAQRGIELRHADPRELRLDGDEVYYEDTLVDVAYRDYEIRDLLALEREEGRPLAAIRALFRQNRMISSIAGDLDHKSCWEVLTTDELAARYFSVAERQLFRRHILWTRVVAERRVETPDGDRDLPEYIREHREDLVLKPNRGYGGSGVHLGVAQTEAQWDALLDAALDNAGDSERGWVVQAAATLPVHLFPVLDAHGRTHDEPFYAVMGFAPTDHGLGIIARVSQKQVVNVAQRGGLAAVLVGHRPGDLASPTRSPVRADLAMRELRATVFKLRDLEAVIQVLEWDEETYRPAGAAENRASQLAVLGGLRHELLVSDRLGDLMDSVSGRPDLGRAERAELERLRRVRRTAIALPQTLVAAFAEARSHCLAAWEHARTANDFRLFAKPFDLLLKLLRERADALKIGEDLYDGLLDDHEPGMRRARLEPLLEATGDRLRTLVPAWTERTRRWAGTLPKGSYAENRQRDFCGALLADMGFDFRRGRLDRSTHPFTMMAGEDDVRLTIRSYAHDPLPAILATLHEGGHALYDQGLPAELHGTLLADAPSMGLHESQARLWENHVGRSAAFWSHYFGRLVRAFPAALAKVDPRQFHRAMNVIAPGQNRVAADEATYNLHVLVRYELEIALLAGDLAVTDLPGAWNERYRHYLGVTAAAPRDGCLQDVHWALGEFGYFPTYTIGNLYAAQLVDAYARAHDLDAELARGDLESLRGWLAAKVYAHGAKLDAEDLIEAATGHRLDVEPFFRRLEQRVAELD
ncbi:MAG TPA: carboxypeptidase M32 [Gammaproteobacteria bacterium]|nr:carboxypeptidase M32 [Gammaproteobacteria bacterium]